MSNKFMDRHGDFMNVISKSFNSYVAEVWNRGAATKAVNLGHVNTTGTVVSESEMVKENIRKDDMSSGNLETRSFLDELKGFGRGAFLDLGHPLLNRIADSFVNAAGIGVIQAVSREAYITAVESLGLDLGHANVAGARKHELFPDLRGATKRKSVEALVKNSGKKSLQWDKLELLVVHVSFLLFSLGLAAGVYSGLTYGLREARGAHDWKNSAVAGAMTGAALALASDDTSHEQIAQCAITGAAISTVANLLAGIF